MNLPNLKIGNLKPKLPIIQGGMAVRISLAPLAAAVANEGGIGVIGASGMRAPELKESIKKAKEFSKGIIGVNIMFAIKEFPALAEAFQSDCIKGNCFYHKAKFDPSSAYLYPPDMEHGNSQFDWHPESYIYAETLGCRRMSTMYR